MEGVSVNSSSLPEIERHEASALPPHRLTLEKRFLRITAGGGEIVSPEIECQMSKKFRKEK